MKKTCFLFLLLLCGVVAIAQDFEIVSVESLPADMSAREDMKTDHNDRQCALLRVATQNIAPNQRESFSFVPDLGSEVVERATRDGEIWLWVSPGLKYLRIKHREWGQYELRLLDYVSRVEPLHTYKVTIKGTLLMALQEQNNNSPTQQYLVFQLSPTNAMLEVDGQLWEVAPDGTAMKFVNFGTYSYRVQAPNYLPETGKVTVDDPKNTKTVDVNLKSDFVEVTLKVDADAEIWVNNEKKGTRTWTGNLGKGNYKIECKQAGHETSMIAKEITADMNGQTIDLPRPTPIYGSLNIESTPNFATIYIDGEMVGETPKYIKEILVGEHTLKLTKEGYEDYAKIIEIVKNEHGQVKAAMENKYDNGIYEGHDYVDLGLPSGLLWATCNVGASTPEDYGNFFAWAETQPKNAYYWDTYKYYINNDNKLYNHTLTKYCTKESYGYNDFTDNLNTLLSEDDAATVNWGEGWRIPTKEEWEELYKNTTVTWTIQNGVNGIRFTASNGNNLFLPAAGYRDGMPADDYLDEFSLFGHYWSSSLSTSYPSGAWNFYFKSDTYKMYAGGRDFGYLVRAVCLPPDYKP